MSSTLSHPLLQLHGIVNLFIYRWAGAVIASVLFLILSVVGPSGGGRWASKLGILELQFQERYLWRHMRRLNCQFHLPLSGVRSGGIHC